MDYFQLLWLDYAVGVTASRLDTTAREDNAELRSPFSGWQDWQFLTGLYPALSSVASFCLWALPVAMLLTIIFRVLGMEYLGSSFIYSGTEDEQFLKNNAVHIAKARDILKIEV